jgi:hypothetical protein
MENIMNDDLAKTISGISELLSGSDLFSSLLSAPSAVSEASSESDNPSLEHDGNVSTMKLLEAFSVISDSSGANFQLLSALKPYLSESRRKKYDTAVSLMQLSRLPQLKELFFKEEGAGNATEEIL